MKSGFIFKAVIHNLKHRKVAFLISVFAIACAFTFLSAVGSVTFGLAASAVNSSLKFPLIVGPEGSSDTQLVMSSIFSIDKPKGKLSYDVYEQLKKDDRVIAAYPMARADSVQGVPIVGVSNQFLADIEEGFFKTRQAIDPKSVFTKVDPYRAVVGFKVYKRYGLKVGSRFFGSHGAVGDADAHVHKNAEYEVVGILNPVNGPEDFTVYCSVYSVWKIHSHGHKGHDHHGEHAENHEGCGHQDEHVENHKDCEHQDEHHGHEGHGENKHHDDHAEKHEACEHHKEHTEQHEHHEKHVEHNDEGKKQEKFDDPMDVVKGSLSAVLVKTRNPVVTSQLEREYSSRAGSTAADTGKTIRRIVQFMNKAENAAGAFSYGTLIIVLVMVFVTILMSINERKKEMALMRTLGIGRGSISLMVMIETVIITILGVAGGVIFGHFILWYMKPVVDMELGINLEPFIFTSVEVQGIVFTLFAGQVLALLGMLRIYRMNLIEEVARD